MNTSIVIIIDILLILLVVAGVAWLVYKAGYRATKMKVKTPVWEADLERKPTSTSPDPAESAVPPMRTEATQTATDGGVIRKSSQKAPADSGAKLSQEAKGEGSRIDDSKIELN